MGGCLHTKSRCMHAGRWTLVTWLLMDDEISESRVTTHASAWTPEGRSRLVCCCIHICPLLLTFFHHNTPAFDIMP